MRLARDDLNFAEKALAIRQTANAQAAADAAVTDRAREVIYPEIEEVVRRCLAGLAENSRDADILREEERSEYLNECRFPARPALEALGAAISLAMANADRPRLRAPASSQRLCRCQSRAFGRKRLSIHRWVGAFALSE